MIDNPTPTSRKVECPVCLDVFKDPRMLQCGHSFCHDCIIDESPIICALCRGVTVRSRDQLRADDTLKGTVDAYKKMKYACTICSDRDDSLKSFWHCQTCAISFVCSECVVDQHTKIHHVLETMNRLYNQRKDQLDQARQNAKTNRVDILTVNDQVRSDLANLEETAARISTAIRTQIRPTFDGALDEVMAQYKNVLDTGDSSMDDSILLNNDRFRMAIEDVGITVVLSKFKQDGFGAKLAKLAEVMNGASSAVDELLAQMMDDGDLKDLRKKTRGLIRLEIDRIAEMQVGSKRRSEIHAIGGYLWNILATCERGLGKGQTLGLFIQCNRASDFGNRSCTAKSTLRVMSQIDPSDIIERSLARGIHDDRYDWGYFRMLDWNDLMDEDYGYLKNGKVMVEAEIEILD